jgi:hypothetical protein
MRESLRMLDVRFCFKPQAKVVSYMIVQVRRKATPRELAEEFRGHGLQQPTWAPMPIFWARSLEEMSSRDNPSALLQVKVDATL